MTGIPRGRPRSLDIDGRVLAAARAILARDGYAAMTMEAVAEAAGVGKQSLYRRWPRKPLLAFDAAYRNVDEVIANLPDTGSFEGDIGAFARDMEVLLGRPETQDLSRGILADSLADPMTLALIRERFIHPQIAALELIVDRARRRGELAPDLETEPIADLLFGAPIGHYLVIGRTSALADRLTRLITRGVLRPRQADAPDA